MDITFICAVYNREKKIKRAVLSWTNLSLPGSKLIVVNDGSTDNTDFVINSLKLKHKFTYINLPDNLGVGAARNKALEIVDTEWVMLLDSDNELTDSLATYLCSPNVALDPNSLHRFNVVSMSKNEFMGDEVSEVLKFTGKKDFLLRRPKGEFHTLVKTNYLKAVGGFDEIHPGGEHLTWASCVEMSKSFYHHPVISMRYDDSGLDRLSNRWANANRIKNLHLLDLRRNCSVYFRSRKIVVLSLIAKVIIYSVLSFGSRLKRRFR